jgi:hypothetical protein
VAAFRSFREGLGFNDAAALIWPLAVRRMAKITTIPEDYNDIRAEIVELLKTARSAAARDVNSIMTAAYWEIGR